LTMGTFWPASTASEARTDSRRWCGTYPAKNAATISMITNSAIVHKLRFEGRPGARDVACPFCSSNCRFSFSISPRKRASVESTTADFSCSSISPNLSAQQNVADGLLLFLGDAAIEVDRRPLSHQTINNRHDEQRRHRSHHQPSYHGAAQRRI